MVRRKSRVAPDNWERKDEFILSSINKGKQLSHFVNLRVAALNLSVVVAQTRTSTAGTGGACGGKLLLTSAGFRAGLLFDTYLTQGRIYYASAGRRGATESSLQPMPATNKARVAREIELSLLCL
jgi:hypothetical protein